MEEYEELKYVGNMKEWLGSTQYIQTLTPGKIPTPLSLYGLWDLDKFREKHGGIWNMNRFLWLG